MTAPSPAVQEVLAEANTYDNEPPWGPEKFFPGRYLSVLAREVHRLRAELADETKQRLVLAATLESDWAEQCNAMAAVVRAAVRYTRWRDSGEWTPANELNPLHGIRVATRDFIASGFLPDIELEDSDHG